MEALRLGSLLEFGDARDGSFFPSLKAASVQSAVPFRPRAGLPRKRLKDSDLARAFEAAGWSSQRVSPPLVANSDGFSLHAAARVKAGERDAKEKLCRYVTLGQTTCTEIPNSINRVPYLLASGSIAVAENDLSLSCSSLPLSTFGFFNASMDYRYVSNPGGSDGVLCIVGAPIAALWARDRSRPVGRSVSLTLLSTWRRCLSPPEPFP